MDQESFREPNSIDRVPTIDKLTPKDLKPGVIIEEVNMETVHRAIGKLLAEAVHGENKIDLTVIYGSLPKRRDELPMSVLESMQNQGRADKDKFNGRFDNATGIISNVDVDNGLLEVIIQSDMISTGRGVIGHMDRVCRAETKMPDINSEALRTPWGSLRTQPVWVYVTSAPINEKETKQAISDLIAESEFNARAASVRGMKFAFQGGSPGQGNKS